MDSITLTIDGLVVTAEKGKTVLETALENGIYIPHLCHHPDLKPTGVCRLCMIEIEGRGMTISCKTPVEQGIVVRTESPEIAKVRRIATELLITDHHSDCLACKQDNHCELQKIAAFVGIDRVRLDRMRMPKRLSPIDSSNPFFDLDPNKCVLCGICVRTCDEIQGVNALDFLHRGYKTKIGTFGDKPIVESVCESCGECVSRCPVGALVPKHNRQPSREVKTVCTYCGVGCGIYLGVRGDTIVGVRADRENPVNRGSLCVKGRFGYDFINHPDRLTTPLIKKDGEFVEAGWDEALALVTKKFAENRGERFVAVSSAKCSNEVNYLIQKFARAVMGTNNVDHCARLCHSPTVAGLAQSFGSGAMTNSINEISEARCILAIGSNTTAAHPIIGLKVKKAVRNGARLIVANPKRIDLLRHAEIFLQHRPGTDVALLMGMMRVIVDEGLYDADFIEKRCENFAAFKKSLLHYGLAFVERTTGVPREKIIEAARCYATVKPASILFAMGITQHSHGTDNVLAVSNLALLTGNIGKPSSGVNPLRGQNNVQGACDLGALPNVYPGYQKVDSPEIRQKFESAWGCALSGAPGVASTEMFDLIGDGGIRAMYLVGENPVLSEANSTHVVETLKKLDFLVVQDIFLTETALLADVVLPAASFAETDGTFTNTERRIQRIRKAIEPIGDAKPDWWITCRIAQKMGAKGFEFSHPREIMEEISTVSPIYAGITYDRIEDVGIQWPCISREHPGTPILHTERFNTASGKGIFKPLVYRESAELPDDDYPLILTTDRSLYHFHTGTMTRRVAGLEKLDGWELLKINPQDAVQFGITDDSMVYVLSRRGRVRVRTKVTDICKKGVVSMTFHFHESPTNVITNAALDPVAKIPETKVCAVRIEKI
ncbi:MAG: formate dehydrogenase subunit alpha [Candidatus Latescibacter sp.]|nr:formate dehydrogenase subunit alpha [Candidatus Latescibacter sp.]